MPSNVWRILPSAPGPVIAFPVDGQNLGQLITPAWPSPLWWEAAKADLGIIDVTDFSVDPTDATAAFQAAEAMAGGGGRIWVPPGTYILNNWTPITSGITVMGSGMGSTILRAKTGAAAAVTISQLAQTSWRGVTFDGNAKASNGIQITGATNASSLHRFADCQFQNSLIGTAVLNGSPTNEADQMEFDHCYWFTNGTHFSDVATNGQNVVMTNVRMSTSTSAAVIVAGNCSLVVNSGQIVLYSTGIQFTGTNGNGQYVKLTDVLFQSGTALAVDIDGSAHWPVLGVELHGCVLQAGMSAGSGKTVSMKATSTLTAWHTAFENGDLTANFGNCYVQDFFCQFSSGATYTASGTTSKRLSMQDAVGAGTQQLTYQRGTVIVFQVDFTANTLTVGGSTSSLGFYGVSPIARAVLATGTGKTVDNVITALQNLGLVSQT